jgi:hypothetical protein
MKRSERLLVNLGITVITDNLINLVDNFLKSGEKDCKKLLNHFGEWDENDLVIAEHWLAFDKSREPKCQEYIKGNCDCFEGVCGYFKPLDKIID